MNDTRRLTLAQVKAIKERRDAELLQLPGVIGVGIGQAEYNDSAGNEHGFCIVITINQECSPDAIPAELEGAPVRIISVGTLKAFDGF
ncbi:MAG: hypothetical protein JXA42_14955 [Anaerolineales bacterium]|nr:hypothetical protein [Anaerolineales bacterium]